MVERMSGLPDIVPGFTTTGTATAADDESRVVPAVEAVRRIGE